MNGSPRRIDLRSDPDADLTVAVDHLRGGGLLAYPTETVYGLGSACTTEGLGRLRRLKRREADKPLIVLVPSAEAVRGLRWTDAARDLAAIFWPGALTLVLEDPERLFPPGVRHPATGAVAVRVTPHPIAARLVAALDAPLTSTSLNAPGERPAASGHDALRVVQALGGSDVLVLDGGTLPPSGPSTVVDCTGREPVLIREGTIPVSRLRCAFPQIHERPL